MAGGGGVREWGRGGVYKGDGESKKYESGCRERPVLHLNGGHKNLRQ